MTRSENLRAPLDQRRARLWLLGLAAIPLAASPVWAATQTATTEVPPPPAAVAPATESPAVVPAAAPPSAETTNVTPPAPAEVAAAAPAPSPMPWPGMTIGLAANPHPATFSARPLGDITVDGVLSGFAMTQSHASYDFFGRVNRHNYADISNAQLIINKSNGVFQFYVQAGAYSLPSLGTAYLKAVTGTGSGTRGATEGFFGPVPQGFIKIVPSSQFSIAVGALPTLQGAEYTFTFENLNIERGLLWNQENAVNRGVQVNFSSGPLSASVAFTDGYFSGRYNSISGLLTYAFKNSDTLTVVGQGQLSTVRKNTLATPATLANSQVFNLIYAHTSGKWLFNPYLQYTHVPSNSVTAAVAPFGGSGSGSTYGGALLVKYSATPMFSISARGEYIKSKGSANLLYGPRSKAWSLTVTPTYQQGVFFLRGEASYVTAVSAVPGFAFGLDGLHRHQARFAGEIGMLF